MVNLEKASFGVAVVATTKTVNAQRQDDRAVRELLAKIKDSSDTVRTEGWQNAGEVGAPAVQPLIKVMGDGDMEVARAAKRAVWRIVRHVGGPETQEGKGAVVRQVASVLEETKSAAVRCEVLWMLSEIGGPRVVEPISKWLTSEECREDARMVLERLGGAKAKAALNAAFRESPGDFKPNLAQSLRKLGVDVQGYPCVKLVPTKKTDVKPVE